jgi:hypothetical protein
VYLVGVDVVPVDVVTVDVVFRAAAGVPRSSWGEHRAV